MPIFSVPPEHSLGTQLQAKNMKLGEGVQGNYDTVAIMKQVAHARKTSVPVRALAEKILMQSGVGSMDYAHEALAIGEYVHKNMRYVRDPAGVEQLQDPLLMIDKLSRGIGQGDCDDMALLIITLLLAIGHEPCLCIVKYKTNQPFFSHIYVVDYEKDQGQEPERIVLDAILKTHPIGTEVPSAYKEEIQV